MKISFNSGSGGGNGYYGEEIAPAGAVSTNGGAGGSILALAITGGGAGFLFGGPVGAVIGAVAGGVIGSKVKPAADAEADAASAAAGAAASAASATAADLRSAKGTVSSTDECLELCAKKADQLVAALREAQSQIDSLSAENAALRGQLAAGGSAAGSAARAPGGAASRAAASSTEEGSQRAPTSVAWEAQQEQRARSAASKAVIDMCVESVESDREE